MSPFFPCIPFKACILLGHSFITCSLNHVLLCLYVFPLQRVAASTVPLNLERVTLPQELALFVRLDIQPMLLEVVWFTVGFSLYFVAPLFLLNLYPSQYFIQNAYKSEEGHIYVFFQISIFTYVVLSSACTYFLITPVAQTTSVTFLDKKLSAFILISWSCEH